MKIWRTRRSGFGLLATLALVLPLTASSSFSSGDVPVQLPPDRDEARAAASASVPGFAGSYLEVSEEGAPARLHVLSTVPSSITEEVKGGLPAVLVPGTIVGEVVVEPATYTFEQLLAWRQAMRNAFTLPQVALLDIDEKGNRVTIGVEDVSVAEAVRDLAGQAGVPLAALEIVIVSPFTYLNLDQQHRPMHGGTQISFQTGTFTTGLCTLGFNAEFEGMDTFVTNAHCSAEPGRVDDSRYWQANRPILGTGQVGTEIVDPPYYSGGDCPELNVCQRVDANIVRIHDGIDSDRAIARPAVSGTTVWDGESSWRVVSAQFTYEGNPVRAVGRTSGMRTGFVDAVCVDVAAADRPGLIYQCQDLSTIASAGGDSGGPVFEAINSPQAFDVRLVGVAWGGGEVDGVAMTASSPYPFLETRLGPLNVCAPGFSC